MRTQKPIGQGFIFAQKPQQQMLGLNIRRPELACFVAREKDYASGFLRVTFKHNALPPDASGRKGADLARPYRNPAPWMFLACIWSPSSLHYMERARSQALKRFSNVTEETC